MPNGARPVGADDALREGHQHTAGRAGQAGFEGLVYLVEAEARPDKRRELEPARPDVLEEYRQRDRRIL